MKTLPYWPKFMKRATACAYLDLSSAEFEREVISGRLPHPVKLGNTEHWDRNQLDQHLDRLVGLIVPDWRETSSLYNEQ